MEQEVIRLSSQTLYETFIECDTVGCTRHVHLFDKERNPPRGQEWSDIPKLRGWIVLKDLVACPECRQEKIGEVVTKMMENRHLTI